LLGFAAGYFKSMNTLLNSFSEMLLAFPLIFLIILILALFGNSIFTVIIVLGLTGWMSLFKIIRSEVISIRQKDFFISAEMLGIKKRNLLFKEILPVIIIPVSVNLIYQFGNVVLAESALSFLGLGAAKEYPSWGSMIEAGKLYLSNGWWMILFPGSALLILLFSLNMLGKKAANYFQL
jgi:peptide/nickel transport system permease protein